MHHPVNHPVGALGQKQNTDDDDSQQSKDWQFLDEFM
jgi:hypothetical protein